MKNKIYFRLYKLHEKAQIETLCYLVNDQILLKRFDDTWFITNYKNIFSLKRRCEKDNEPLLQMIIYED